MYVKLAIIIASILGVIVLGYVMLLVVLPAFALAAIVDFGMRQSYNAKLSQVRQRTDLKSSPRILFFDARFADGQVMIAWHADLPNGSRLDIYRVEGHGGGSVDDLQSRGICIHSTGLELTSTKDELFIDFGLPEGAYFYVPIVSGRSVEQEPLSYHFFDFSRHVEFRTRRTDVVVRGEAAGVVVKPEVVEQLPDHRNMPTKIADEIKAQIKQRRQFTSDLDNAVAQIMSDADLDESEKQIAIELLETRADLT